MIEFDNIGLLINVTILVIMGILLYRIGTKEGWYIKVFGQWAQRKTNIDIPDEALEFNRKFQREDYLNEFLRSATIAVLWLFITWLIDIMALIGGSTLADKSPMFRIPCMILIVVMNLICIYKIVLVYAGVIEDWVFKTIAIVILGQTTIDEPMRLRMSRKEPRTRKEPIFINNELLKDTETPKDV